MAVSCGFITSGSSGGFDKGVTSKASNSPSVKTMLIHYIGYIYMTVDANSFRAHVVTPSFCVSGCCLSDFRTDSVYMTVDANSFRAHVVTPSFCVR